MLKHKLGLNYKINNVFLPPRLNKNNYVKKIIKQDVIKIITFLRVIYFEDYILQKKLSL